MQQSYKFQLCLFFLQKVFKNSFLYLKEGERKRECGCTHAWGREAEREGERNFRRLCTNCRAQRGAQSHDPKIRTWAETKSWTLNWLRHPGAPFLIKFKTFFFLPQNPNSRKLTLTTNPDKRPRNLHKLLLWYTRELLCPQFTPDCLFCITKSPWNAPLFISEFLLTKQIVSCHLLT